MDNKKKWFKKEKISKLINKKYIMIVLFLILLLLFILFRVFYKTDGMEQAGVYNLYYKTYTKENGWSKWTKNGMTSGDYKLPIEKIEFKLKNKKDGEIHYTTFDSKNGWSSSHSMSNLQNLKGIEISLSGNLYKKYNVYYRTYNNKDKWLNWSSDGDINGNANQNITAVEVKIIPRNVISREYLKNFSLEKIKNKNFNGR